MRFLFTIALFSSFAVSLMAQSQAGSLALTSLNAVPRGSQVLISWNPDKQGVITYSVERSKNGSDFVKFSEVEGGNTALEFLETDYTPLTGTSYYRVSATDEDGFVTYSNVVPVKYSANGTTASPVNTSNTTSTQKDKAVLMIVRGSNGEEYYSKVDVENVGDPVQCSDPDPTLAVGTYTIVGCSEQALYAKQLIVK